MKAVNEIRHFLYKKNARAVLWNGFAVIVAFVFLFPLYWILISSLKTDAEVFRMPPTLFPHKFTLEAYIGQLFGAGSILLSIKNSFIIAVSAMTVSFCFAVPAAYGVSRFNIPGKKILLLIFLVTQMLPVSLLLTPMFLTFSHLKLLNTYLAPILAVTTITVPFTLLILRPMFMQCPKEIEESARIDGCNRFIAFLLVVAPVIKPGLITVCCFGFVHGWNDLMYSLTFNTKRALFPMTASIYNLINDYGIRWSWIMAYGCLLVLPPILIFILAQKYVINGIAGGAVKG